MVNAFKILNSILNSRNFDVFEILPFQNAHVYCFCGFIYVTIISILYQFNTGKNGIYFVQSLDGTQFGVFRYLRPFNHIHLIILIFSSDRPAKWF